jgi:CubicO group peptidase (beta-lactamase class C family)
MLNPLNRKAFSFFLLFLTFFLFLDSRAQDLPKNNPNSSLAGSIDSILNAQVNVNKIPGAVIQVKQSGNIIYQNAYGYAQKYDDRHQPLPVPEKMQLNTLFDIASLTKVTVTTTAIMLLVDQGKLSVDDPVSRFLPEFGSRDKKDMKIRHLLTHTAGLYEWYPMYYISSNKKESYLLIDILPLKYPIGRGRHYSDLGFVLLGEIIELISGLSLEQFAQQNIFLPLGMNHTLFNPKAKGRVSNIAATSFGNPYEKRMVHDSTLGFQVKGIDPDHWNGWRTYLLKGEVNDGNAWYANGGISGAAGLFSTAADLQILVDMLMNRGMSAGRQFITEKTVELFLTMDNFRNGLGWAMDPESSYMKNAPAGSFGHTGFTGTSIVAVPKYGVSVILLINRQHEGLQSNGEYYNVGPIRQEIFETVMRYCGKE